MADEPEVKPEVKPEAKLEEKSEAKDGAVREAAHAAADVEAGATIELARVEEEAKKLAKIAGEEAAQKWFEAKSSEIMKAAEQAFEKVKQSFEDRLAAVEGKLKPAQTETAPGTANGPAPVAPAAPSERPRRKLRFI